jgi:hypothetical protein
MNITVKVRKPHLRDYIRYTGQASTSTKHIVGALLAPFVELRPPDVKPVANFGAEEQVSIELVGTHMPNGSVNYRGVAYVSERNQQNFERALDRVFDCLFFSYVDDKVRYEVEMKKCILQFCSDHGITYDTDVYEMLKKRYYRERKKRAEKKKTLPKNVPETSLSFLL